MALDVQPISAPAPAPRKKKRGCFSCAMASLALGGAFVLWALWSVAATGFVRIPVFSALAFQQPVPTRIVEGGNVNPNRWIEQAFGQGLTSRVSLTVPEEVLTALLRSADTSDGLGDVIDFSKSQIAVEDGALEIFLPFKDASTAVTALLVPSADENGLHISAMEFRIGSRRIPKFLLRNLVDRVLRLVIDRVEDEFGSMATIERIAATADGLVIEGVIADGALSL